MAGTLTANNSANAFCVSHTVSFLKNTSTFTAPSGAVERMKSPPWAREGRTTIGSCAVINRFSHRPQPSTPWRVGLSRHNQVKAEASAKAGAFAFQDAEKCHNSRIDPFTFTPVPKETLFYFFSECQSCRRRKKCLRLRQNSFRKHARTIVSIFDRKCPWCKSAEVRDPIRPQWPGETVPAPAISPAS